MSGNCWFNLQQCDLFYKLILYLCQLNYGTISGKQWGMFYQPEQIKHEMADLSTSQVKHIILYQIDLFHSSHF